MDLMNKVQSIAGNVITPVDFVEVKVDFGSGLVADFAETYASTINSKFALRGSALNVSSEEMLKYLNTLLLYRIQYINGQRVPQESRSLMIPALVALTLNNIGKVYDKDYGVELIPVLEGEIDVMDIKEALLFSRQKLLLAEDLGFELVEGLPKDRTGEANFMFFHFSGDSILRHNNAAHPGYAVLAAFFKMQQLTEVLSFRSSYGLQAEYKEMLTGLIYDESRRAN